MGDIEQWTIWVPKHGQPELVSDLMREQYERLGEGERLIEVVPAAAYRGAVDAIKRVKTALDEVAFHHDISDGALAYLAAALERPTYHQRGQ